MKKTAIAPAGESLVIVCHGVGAFGYDLDPLAGVLRKGIPGAVVVAPDAPFAFDLGPGRQWYSQRDISPETRMARVAVSRGAFDNLIAELVAEHGLQERLDRVALIGFSQGAIMVLDAYASGRWPVAAVVALSGRLSTPPPLAPARDTPLMLVHGLEDPVVPPSESEHTYAVLTEMGIQVEKHMLPGVGHVIAPRSARLATRFARDNLARSAIIA